MRSRVLSPADVEDIQERFEDGESVAELAAAYDVSASTIYRALDDNDDGDDDDGLDDDELEEVDQHASGRGRKQ